MKNDEDEDFVQSKFEKHKKKKSKKKYKPSIFVYFIFLVFIVTIFYLGYFTCYLLHFSNNNTKNNNIANNNITNNYIANNNITNNNIANNNIANNNIANNNITNNNISNNNITNNNITNNNITNNNITNNNITNKTINNHKNINTNLLNEINKIYNSTYKVNINSIEEQIKKQYDSSIEKNDIPILSTIHVVFGLDSNYILETMLTVASILATQKNTTKIVLHFGITQDFTAEHMLKMYELKNRINNLTEFNFYYINETMIYMKDYFKKLGPASPGRIEVIKLVPDYIERLLIFDAGDVLIFRDLTEFYNYDMKDYMVLGLPEPFAVQDQKNKENKKYINMGSLLVNVKEFKKMNFWDIFKNSTNIPVQGSLDQSLFNHLIPDNKKNYFPFRFGGYTHFVNDYDSDFFKFYGFQFKTWLKSDLSNSLPEKPNSLHELIAQLYNSVFIHQFVGKWYKGKGLSIYRNLVKYFIKIAGIWDELCTKSPGYCY